MEKAMSLAPRRVATHWPGLQTLAAAALLASLALPALAADGAAALRTVDVNKCSKCHDVERKKDGPAYRDVAAKYRLQADAEAKVTHHVTAGDKVKFPDGHEEKHKRVKSDDPAEVQNLVRWILALEGGTKY
jgi:cytochrome c